MKWLRRSLYVIGGLLLLVVICGAGGYLWLRTSLPQTTGSVAVPRLGAQVEIARDGDGVVTIRAQSEADAFYALGFAHAQDRLFQMDMMRRLGAGRLSEVVGDATVNVDKTMRILGLYRLAEAGLAKLPNEMRVTLEAYAAGVNAFLATRSGTLPPEFVLLRYTPEPWRPADSLVWGRLMAWQLSGNWSEELLRYRLAARLTPAQLNELWRAPPADDLGIPQAERPDDHAAAAPALPDVLRGRGASNNFVVAGNRSATGKPLLANDPHLGLQSPIQWHLVRLETPTLTLVGATAPGVPMLVIGHNGHVAWSFVTTSSDTQDLFLEKLLPGDPTHYLAPAGPLAFETRNEIIKVEGADDIALTARRSRHGPILSDAPSLEWTDPTQVLSLAWPGLDEDDGTAAALYRINRARNARELLDAAGGFGSPMQNILYADTQGHIGFIAPGRMPLRKKLNAAGQMPAPGWTGDYDWTGYQPVDSLPQIADPQQGWLATANNDIRPEDYGRFLSGRWEAPYRYNRIAELLEATPQQTLDTLAAIQMDDTSVAAQEVVSVLLDAIEPNMSKSPTTQAWSLLKDWDFRMSRDRPEPLIFTAWMAELDKAILSDKLGDLFRGYASWNLARRRPARGAAGVAVVRRHADGRDRKLQGADQQGLARGARQAFRRLWERSRGLALGRCASGALRPSDVRPHSRPGRPRAQPDRHRRRRQHHQPGDAAGGLRVRGLPGRAWGGAAGGLRPRRSRPLALHHRRRPIRQSAVGPLPRLHRALAGRALHRTARRGRGNSDFGPGRAVECSFDSPRMTLVAIA